DRLRALAGLDAVATAARAAAEALTAKIRAGELHEPTTDGRIPSLDADMAWDKAQEGLASVEVRRKERHEYLEGAGIKHTVELRRKVDIRDAVGTKPTPSDLLLVHTYDAASPIAPGGIGNERIIDVSASWIVGLASPWSMVAWLG